MIHNGISLIRIIPKTSKTPNHSEIMNKTLTAISVIAGLSLLAGTTFAFSGETLFGSSDLATMSDRSFMNGHITLAVYDEFGNLKHYQQTDNSIVNIGEGCIADYLFGTNSACTPGTADFDTIFLGTNASPTGTTSRGTITTMLTTVLTGATSAVAITQTSGNADPGNVLSKQIITVIKTFSPAGTATFKEVSLNNDANNLLAYQALGDATINGGADSLTVTWTITIG